MSVLELALIFVGGFLVSYHCIGMCGPLALIIGSGKPQLKSNLGRQLVFSAGRIFTYAFLGAIAGFAGMLISKGKRLPVMNVQAWLAIVAGVLLIAFGLFATGIFSRRSAGAGQGGVSCLAATWLKTFLTSSALVNVFLAGLFTGFIPCGMVYVFAAKAAATGSLFFGLLTMIAFGLGTVPLMVLAGCGASVFSHVTRAKFLKVAAWCIVLTGAITLTRGAVSLGKPLASGTQPNQTNALDLIPFCGS